MFFSAKQLFDNMGDRLEWELADFYGKEVDVTLSRVKKYVAACKKAIVSREKYCNVKGTCSGIEYNFVELHKWIRPWHVLPNLKNFSAPSGDYGIGVELEAGFVSKEAAQVMASKVQHWRNITLDWEYGINNPIEATFPPFLYSKMSSKCQPFRYAKLLAAEGSGVHHHNSGSEIGCHINVSKGGKELNYRRVQQMASILEVDLRHSEKYKYFGRLPYGYCYYEENYVEFKLFNSTTDVRALRRYIHMAVALADIIYGEQHITAELVRTALSTAYNKR